MMGESFSRLGLGLLAGAAMAMVAGCASMAGWGPPPDAPPASVAASTQNGAAPFGPTRGRVTKAQAAVKVPPNVRVQDCAIVAISSPARYACGGKVYTSFELARAREKATAAR